MSGINEALDGMIDDGRLPSEIFRDLVYGDNESDDPDIDTRLDESVNEASRKVKAKQAWMSKASDIITKADSKLSGKIDWDTLTYLYNSGKSPDEGAKAILKIAKKESIAEKATAKELIARFKGKMAKKFPKDKDGDGKVNEATAIVEVDDNEFTFHISDDESVDVLEAILTKLQENDVTIQIEDGTDTATGQGTYTVKWPFGCEEDVMSAITSTGIVLEKAQTFSGVPRGDLPSLFKNGHKKAKKDDKKRKRANAAVGETLVDLILAGGKINGAIDGVVVEAGKPGKRKKLIPGCPGPGPFARHKADSVVSEATVDSWVVAKSLVGSKFDAQFKKDWNIATVSPYGDDDVKVRGVKQPIAKLDIVKVIGLAKTKKMITRGIVLMKRL